MALSAREQRIESTPKQHELFTAALSGTYRYILFGGGIRGGKTFGLLLLLLALCKLFPGSRWAIVRKDLPTLRRNILPAFNKLRFMGFGGFISPFNGTDWTARCTNGSEIILFPESVKDDPELERWRGLEVNGFALDEGNELVERSFYKAIERAGSWIIAGAAKQPPPLVLVTCNPSPGWVKRLFYDRWKVGTLEAPFLFIPATAADNPHIPDATRSGWLNLTERDYRRFVMGEWDDLTGVALDELDEGHHLVNAFEIPSHWRTFASFDWGFAHPFVWLWYAVDEDGAVFVVDTTKGRRFRDDQIVERVKDSVPPGMSIDRLDYVAAGHDCWGTYKAKSTDNTESTQERFASHDIYLSQANIARQAGLENLRNWLAWRPAKAGLPERTPRLRFMRTRANLLLFDRLKEVMLDPDDPRDALKTDADPETGEGGDDEYDALRYGLASRPMTSDIRPPEDLGAWDPKVLAYEAEQKRKGLPLIEAAKVHRPIDPATYYGGF